MQHVCIEKVSNGKMEVYI